MKPADKLLVLRNGRIQAFGATAEVLRDLKMVGSDETSRSKPPPMVPIGERLA
jgi:ABC-type protease/lipase transport system fused ATPase/permease subunit